MALFKCKMCGGALEINNNETIATCEYCGTQQTLPKLDDDKRANMYDRANHFRRNNEFDKAMGMYEQILNEDKADAEAYWSLVLCRYGIEYVKDPTSHKRVPTVNRAQFTSIFDDDNYKSALQYADSYQKSIYEEEAKTINEIQKGILAISQKEEPFDIFICYKESDSNGRRTHDSVLANDLYHQLTQEGFKVFFARITLEDKLGSAYEPYIFAALNSAKVMVVLGTKPEFFNAVWVKNEWSRYLALIKQGQKKTLIPAYKDMDPYDLPEEFSHLQAQDMGKLGFMQDLIRGIKKIVQADAPKATVVKETVIGGGSANAAPLLKRAFMFLEDGAWIAANEYCEKVLDIEPENAMAYLGKLLADRCLSKPEALADVIGRFDGDNNYQKAIRFADERLKATLNGYVEAVNARIYNEAKNTMSNATTQAQFQEAAKLFERISDYYSDSAALAQTCLEKAEIARKDAIYNKAKNTMSNATTQVQFIEAAELFESISDYSDSAALAQACFEKAEIARKDPIYKKAKGIMANATTQAQFQEAAEFFESISDYSDSAALAQTCFEKAEIARKDPIYKKAKGIMANATTQAQFQEAAELFKSISDYSDSAALAQACFEIGRKVAIYNKAKGIMSNAATQAQFQEATELFKSISAWKDADEQIVACQKEIEKIKAMDEARRLNAEIKRKEAKRVAKRKKITIIIICAIVTFMIALNNYIIPNSKYNKAISLMENGEYTEAISAFEALDDYKDSVDKINECKYNIAIDLMENGEYTEAISAFEALDDYKDGADKINECKYNREIDLMKNAEVGDEVIFGSYEQDNYIPNGTEEIEWLVLEKSDNKILVISKYALDCKPYNTTIADVTWETCTLRQWLNNDFINSAFSDEEKAKISTVTVSADENPDYSTNPGNATQDQVFLLSITEAKYKYLRSSTRQCKATDYAVAHGAYVNSNNGNCWWWLRSPGQNQYFAAYVYNNGTTNVYGNIVYYSSDAVRPALWVDLNS